MFYVFDDELKSIEIEEISKNMLCAGFMTVGEFERLATVFSLPKNIVELCKKDSDKNFLTKFLNDDLTFLRLNIMCNNNKNNEIALIVMKNMIMAVDICDEFSFNQKCFLNALSNCACESVTAEKLICSFLEIIAKQCSANYNEGPGENEDLQGQPFVGRSGQLLDKFLASVDLSRDKNVYIANMVKCRPPKNRDPKPEEQDMCINWLREQFKIIKPKIVVCVGRISAQKLIDKNFKVTQQHGQFIDKNGTLFMGTYHPAAILRNPNNKEFAFADWLALRDKIDELGIEI